jgi:hypothetical protein
MNHNIKDIEDIDIQLDMTYFGNVFPETISKKINNKFYIYVPVIVEENTDQYKYIYKYICMKPYEYEYKNLVSFIICMKYSSNDETAILMNYMFEPNNEKYIKEYNELQSWRLFAKNYAKKHFNLV